MRFLLAATLCSVSLASRPAEAMFVDFDWVSVGSDEDTGNPVFPTLLGGPLFPDTKLNGGLGTVTSIVDLPGISSVVSTPTDLTFSFGSQTNPAVSPALVLTGFDNGDTTGTAIQEFGPQPGTTDNTLQLFNAGVLVAQGQLLGVTIFTDLTLTSTGIGSFKLDTLPMGADPTILNEILSLTGGTGVVSFSLTDFAFAGVAEFAGGSVFTADGSAMVATPEPTIVLLLGLAAIPLAWRRRRSSLNDADAPTATA